MARRLYRSRSDRLIWGVCGGLAEYFDMDPTIVRIIAVLSVFITGLGIVAYIILALVLPLVTPDLCTLLVLQMPSASRPNAHTKGGQHSSAPLSDME